MSYSDWELEKKLWKSGFDFVAGIDEAGRGPWAGPVVAGITCFEQGFDKDLELRDSKKMTEIARDRAYEKIIENAFAWGVGIVEATEIDRLGITEAVSLSMRKAIYQAEKNGGIRLDYLIIDGAGVKSIPGYKQSKINKADSLHASVSAGAIVAKVTRDKLMVEYADEFPQYGFERNKAYGTKEHQEALLKYGPTKIHRFSYKPVAEAARSSQVGKSR